MELSEPTRLLAGKAIIRNAAGQVLVLQQAHEAAVSNSGLYQLPGGIISFEESIAGGVEREVEEETGLKVTVENFIAHGEWTAKIRGEDFVFTGLFFICTVDDGNVDTIILDPDESASYMWVDASTLGTITVVEPARSIIAAQF